jgi:hypothetical protein
MITIPEQCYDMGIGRNILIRAIRSKNTYDCATNFVDFLSKFEAIFIKALNRVSGA